MEYKNFISDQGWFSLQIPSTWDEYDDNYEGTYAFFDTIKWTGNLRITPIKLEVNSKANKAREIIEKEYLNIVSKKPKKIQIGDSMCVTYKTYADQNNDELIIYYWILEKNNCLFTFSFSIDKENDETELNNQELKKIMNIILSIKTVV